MACNDIGKNISKIRKALGITQSELGQAVGVSTQAVSRWECGGMPDTELLPVIADKLDVSIDSLFGRKNSSEINIQTLLYNEIKDTPDKNKMEVICKYIWLMQQAASTKLLSEVKPLEDMLSAIESFDRDVNSDENLPWQIIISNDYGNMIYGLTNDMKFALVLPEYEKGYASMLKNPDEYVRLFKLLSKPNYLDMLISIYMSTPSENFTVNLASSKLNISVEDAKKILNDLYEHCMINHITVVDKDNILDVYSMEPSIKLEIFLFFCNTVMKSVKEIPSQVTSRKNLFLKVCQVLVAYHLDGLQ